MTQLGHSRDGSNTAWELFDLILFYFLKFEANYLILSKLDYSGPVASVYSGLHELSWNLEDGYAGLWSIEQSIEHKSPPTNDIMDLQYS